MSDWLALLFLSAALGDLALEYLLGISPLLAVTRKVEAARGLAAGVAVVAPLAVLASWLVTAQLLVPLGLTALRLPVIVLVITLLVQGLAAAVARLRPAWREDICVFTPLLLINCVLLGTVLVSFELAGDTAGLLALALGLPLGYALLLVVFAHLRERLAASDVPAPFAGAPIALISLAIIAMALSGFSDRANLLLGP